MNKLPKNINLLTMVNVIHHIPPDILLVVIEYLKKILIKGASIIIKEHNCSSSELGKKDRYLITEWHHLYQKVNNESNFMGYLYLIDFPHIKLLMMNIGAICIEHTQDDEDDILKEYFAWFKKF
jgi:hypothetical protein